MDIDLTGQNDLDLMLAFNTLDGEVTLMFMEGDPGGGGAILGTLKIETAKYRALMDSLFTVSTEVPEQTFSTEFDHKTFYRVKMNSANIKFT